MCFYPPHRLFGFADKGYIRKGVDILVEFDDYVIVNLTSHRLDFSMKDEGEIRNINDAVVDFSVCVDEPVHIQFGDIYVNTPIGDSVKLSRRVAIPTPESLKIVNKYINMDTGGKFKILVVSFPTLSALNTVNGLSLVGSDYAIVSTTSATRRGLVDPFTGKKVIIASAKKFTTL